MLLKFCEFLGQRAHELPIYSPSWRIVAPHGHERQCPPPHLSQSVISISPTKARSIVGVHPVSVHFLDLPILPRGQVTWIIYLGPLVVHLPIKRFRLLWYFCFLFTFSFPRHLFWRWHSLPLRADLRLRPSPSYVSVSVTYKHRYRTVAHPCHQHLVQCRSAFQQAHFWILQANKCQHLQQASTIRLPKMSGGWVPPDCSVSFYYLFTSWRLLTEVAVDLTGSLSLASSPISSGDFEGENNFYLMWTWLASPLPWYFLVWVVPMRRFFV